ncbi:hypothetical protein MA16_Dca021025 [Dendrobium catenatum]|uniref:Uncharacterized protein n=1 Tax=Dendrobium catenatum TaxID=906689 RepID=A0A2I0X633_9ASPA|nr:hypothetical protein MA16_Dca021025 [Dendrobium catenatum]
MATLEVPEELHESKNNLELTDNEVNKNVLNYGMISFNSNTCQISENRFQILMNKEKEEDVLIGSGKPAIKVISCKDGTTIAREDVVISEDNLKNSVREGSCSRGEKINSGTGDVVKSKLAKEIRSLGPILVGLLMEVLEGRLGVLRLKNFNAIFSFLEL